VNRNDDETLMPWNTDHFPRSMLHLPPAVHDKAMEIANVLLTQGYDEGRAIRIAIAQAKRWGTSVASQARAV
jgi:uncharacterized protein YdaT